MKQIAVFFDLQGTLGRDGLGHILDFALYPTAVPALILAQSAGWLSIIVTNQSQIGRGKLTYGEYEAKMTALKRELAGHGVTIDAVYCCPHIPTDNCSCKKPLPGMLRQAERDFDLDIARSVVVGDTGPSDMAMARAAGCKAVLVRTGLGEGSLGEFRHLWAGIEPDFVAVDVLEAVRWIVRQGV